MLCKNLFIKKLFTTISSLFIDKIGQKLMSHIKLLKHIWFNLMKTLWNLWKFCWRLLNHELIQWKLLKQEQQFSIVNNADATKLVYLKDRWRGKKKFIIQIVSYLTLIMTINSKINLGIFHIILHVFHFKQLFITLQKMLFLES